MSIQVVILAAGQGKRMFSDLPKVLHTLAGKPLLSHVIETAAALSDKKPVLVFGHQGNKLREHLSHHAVEWVEQKEQSGTGHALLQALPLMSDKDKVLVLYGDVPLISAATLKKLMDTTPSDAIGMITAHLSAPQGYGRIKRDAKQKVTGIVEEKDANDEERAITEINSGIYFVPAGLLKKWLPSLTNHNAQKEYYLTDIFHLAANENIVIHTVQPARQAEISGVNDRVQLAALERGYQQQMAEKFMRQGVTLLDPLRFDVRGEVQIGRDVVIDVNVILEGKIIIGDGCRIGANVILRDTELGKQIEVKANSMIDGAIIHDHCIIGPFARIRPETTLQQEVHVGNFVEVKKSHIAKGSKVNHLSYIGDSEIGKQVNVGAGTITCNYDGISKHKTIIHDHVFIGSDTQLVAPVTIGEGATIGAGSTITQDAPAHQLTLSRGRQQTIEGWTRKKKEK
jgi:bifunctional UDP-N-acetylglucosamine pyrophosphorylase/glucosamine-1-phosphate N-acetyltransferase